MRPPGGAGRGCVAMPVAASQLRLILPRCAGLGGTEPRAGSECVLGRGGRTRANPILLVCGGSRPQVSSWEPALAWRKPHGRAEHPASGWEDMGISSSPCGGFLVVFSPRLPRSGCGRYQQLTLLRVL